MGNAKNANNPDPKCRIQSDTFIGILREEYKIQRNNERRENGNNSLNGEGSNQINIVDVQTIQEISYLGSADRQIPALGAIFAG